MSFKGFVYAVYCKITNVQVFWSTIHWYNSSFYHSRLNFKVNGGVSTSLMFCASANAWLLCEIWRAPSSCENCINAQGIPREVCNELSYWVLCQRSTVIGSLKLLLEAVTQPPQSAN